MEYEDQLTSINDTILEMPAALEASEDKVLRKIGSVVKKNAVRFLHESGIENIAKQITPSNYDGSQPYVHMKSDVRFRLKRDKNGNRYVSIGGGKYTGYKWIMLDQGHLARDKATFIPGTNFVGRAVSASEGEVKRIIDDMLRKLVD